MLRLQTFGGCLLMRDGTRLDGLGQRKALALLALLATAGELGVSRATLLAYLWPESDEDRARDSLKQLVHVIRTRLAADLVLGSSELRLNPELISADVTEFRAALGRHDHDAAAAAYSGPFLDGFFLKNADGFERWVATEREALARQFSRALEALAERASAAGDARAAVEAWRRVVAADPLSARATMGLMRALNAAGDRAASLVHARAYERLVRQELDTAPDPSITALVARMASSPVDVATAPGAHPVAVTPGAVDTATAIPGSRSPPSPSRHSRQVLPAAALILVVLVVVGWAALRGTGTPNGLVAGRIAVAPFENLTGDPALDHVGRVTADWLTQAITEADSVDVVSSASVAIVLRDAKGSMAERRDRLVKATRAQRVVTGGYAKRGGDSLVLHASVMNAHDDRVLWTLDPATSPIADPTVAIQALREQLLGAIVSDLTPRARVRGIRPPRYSAYREYLTAAELFERHFDFEGARPHLERAVALDSSFAAAWTMLVGTYMNRGEFGPGAAVLRRMERVSHLFSPTDLEFLEWARANVRLDYERLFRSAQQLARRDSNPVWLYLTGVTSAELLRPRLAVPALERSDSLMVANGWRLQPWALAVAYHQAGEHDREIATVLRGRHLFPGEGEYLGRQLGAYAALERPAEAIALADTILRGIPDSIGASAGRVLIGAAEFRVHGDSGTAARMARMVTAWYAEHPVRSPPAGRSLLEGYALYVTKQFEVAALHLARATADTANLDPAGYLALTKVALGDRRRATEVADSLGALRREWLFGAHTRWRAAILGALGERERAVELLRLAAREGDSRPAWHTSPSLDALRGYPPFEELIRPER